MMDHKEFGEFMSKPSPGSDAARKLGCKCPVLDNAYGKGYMGQSGVFVYNETCNVHPWPNSADKS